MSEALGYVRALHSTLATSRVDTDAGKLGAMEPSGSNFVGGARPTQAYSRQQQPATSKYRRDRASDQTYAASNFGALPRHVETRFVRQTI